MSKILRLAGNRLVPEDSTMYCVLCVCLRIINLWASQVFNRSSLQIDDWF